MNDSATADSPVDRQVEQTKRDFDRDGFVILRGYASPAEVAQLRAHAEPLAERLLAPLRGTDQHFKDTLKNLNHECSWFAEQLAAGRHVPLMRTLIGDELEPATAAWFDRPAGSGQVVAPHIDGGGRGRGPSVGATIWIALDAAGLDNGCLHYGRGSHLTEFSKGVFVGDFDKCKNAVATEVSPGDAVVHNALTVHWSGPNLSNRPRRAVSFFYWGATSHAAWLKRWSGKDPTAMYKTKPPLPK